MKEIQITKKKISTDFILNIMASFIITATMQLLAYPIIANKVNEEEFGSILTMIGIFNVLATVFGASLNNIKLLHQDKYKKKKGDFNILLKKSVIIITICMISIMICSYGNKVNIITRICIIVVPSLMMMRSYAIVYYRIALNYKLMFKQTIVTSFGYLLGIILFEITGIWIIIFFIGEILGNLYIIKSTDLIKEKNLKTENYQNIKKDFRQLVFSNLIGNITIYLDRLIIGPILGAENVTIYFVAGIVGKMASIIFQPISGIMLTYLSKLELTPRKVYKKVSLTLCISTVLIYLISRSVTPIVVNILYKETYEAAKYYFNIANLGALLIIMGGILQTIILKYCDIIWQSVVQIVYLIIYIVGGIIFMKKWGLIGFCYIALIANFIRIAMLLIIGYKNIK